MLLLKYVIEPKFILSICCPLDAHVGKRVLRMRSLVGGDWLYSWQNSYQDASRNNSVVM